MKTRFITGIILAIVLVPLLFLPALVFYSVVGLFCLIAAYELFAMYESVKVLPRFLAIYLGIGTLWLYGALLFITLGLFGVGILLLWLFLIPMIGLMLMVFVDSFKSVDLGKMMLGMIYVGITFGALAMVFSQGVVFLGYVLILSMVTDIFAYLIGIKFGKHRLAVKISPKKSIEGAVGGTFVAVIIASIYAFYFDIFVIDAVWLRIIVMVFSGIFISILAQIGDLVASSLKREHEIKDFSNLFPGHGGVLDRFDSTAFASLAMVIVLTILGVI